MKTKYIVTAYEFSKKRRAILSQRISRKHAEQFADRINYEMEISIEKYKFFTDIRIEKCSPEYGYKPLK